MSTLAHLTRMGQWPSAFRGTVDTPTLTTAMTTAANGYVVGKDFTVVTTSGATGNAMVGSAKAESQDWHVIANQTANALAFFPATAAGKINGGTAGASFAIPANKNIEVVCIGNDNWLAFASA